MDIGQIFLFKEIPSHVAGGFFGVITRILGAERFTADIFYAVVTHQGDGRLVTQVKYWDAAEWHGGPWDITGSWKFQDVGIPGYTE